MRLVNEEISLRALDQEDGALLHELALNSTGVKTTTPYWRPRARQWFEEFVEAGNADFKKMVRLAIEVLEIPKKKGRLVGVIELLNINWIHGRAEVGIILFPDDARGHGVGPRALNLLCSWAFGTLRLHRLYAKSFASNDRALRCFKKAGFSQEGLLRDHFYVNGRWVDGVQFGRLRHE